MLRKLSEHKVACRILSSTFSILLCISLFLSIFLGVLAANLSSPEKLAKMIVTPEYLEEAARIAVDAMVDQSLMYGIEEDVLTAVVDEQEEEMRRVCLASVKSFLLAVTGRGTYQPAKFSPEPFASALETYLDSVTADDPSVTVRPGAIEENAEELASIVTSACAPVSDGMFSALFDAVFQKVPKSLFSFLVPAAIVSVVLTLLSAILLFFLTEKKRRLFSLGGALFCGSTLSFVPAFFLFFGVDLKQIALAQGVLRTLLDVFVAAFVTPIRFLSAIALILSVSLLGIGLWHLLTAPALKESLSEPFEEKEV